MTELFIGSNIYRGSSYGPLHPLSIPRVPVVIDLARALGWLPADRYRTSPMAKPAALERFHTADYVAALLQAEKDQAVSDTHRDRHHLGTFSNPVFPEMYRRPATAVGGGLLAAELVADGGVVFNPGGGTHHGMADRAGGFCYLNEPVLTIQRLIELGCQSIVYVDIDAHHCDGVEAAFHGSDIVRMVSLHEQARWPFTGAVEDDAGGAAINIPVPRGFNDTEFDLIFDQVILPAVQSAKPDAIFLQCGADALTEDPLSRLALSNNCHAKAARMLREMAPRLIVSGGGGYNPWSVGRAWTNAWAALAGFEVPKRLPDHACQVLRDLTWPRKAQPNETILTTLQDAPRHGALRDEVRDLVDRLKPKGNAWSG